MEDVQKLVSKIHQVRQQRAAEREAQIAGAQKLREELGIILSGLADDLKKAREANAGVFDTYLDSSDVIEAKTVTLSNQDCQALYFGDLVCLYRVLLEDSHQSVAFGMVRLTAGEHCEKPVFTEVSPSHLDALRVRSRVLTCITPFVTPK